MPFIASLFFGFVPMLFCAYFLYWLDRFEKEPIRLLGIVFTWGAVVAAAAAFVINTLLGISFYLFTASEGLTDFATGAVFAPPVEEILKGAAVLVIFLVFRSEFDSILDGIIYAGIAALGFAATENTFYIYSMGYLENGWDGFLTLVFFRVIIVAWQHPFYTAFFGIGLGVARTTKHSWLKWLAPISGLAAAIFLHSLHNVLAGIGNQFFCVLGSLLDWSGWIAMLIFIIIMIERERKMINNQLQTEVGVSIPQELFDLVSSPNLRLRTVVSSVFRGTLKKTRYLFQLCAELAHKKNQALLVGESEKTLEKVHSLRKELKELSAASVDLID